MNALLGSRLFTNFVTNWAQGVEIHPDEREQKQSQDALVADQNDEENAKLQSSAAKSQERAAATTAAVNAATGVPPLVTYLLDSGMTGVGLGGNQLLQQRNPLYYPTGSLTTNANMASTPTTSAFPSSLTGVVTLQQQQVAQILAEQHLQQQQLLLLQHQQLAQRATDPALNPNTNTGAPAQRGPSLSSNLYPPYTPAPPFGTTQQLTREAALMAVTVTGQQKTKAFQSALAPITTGAGSMDTGESGTSNGGNGSQNSQSTAFPNPHVGDLKFHELEAEFKFKPLHAISLPHLDSKSFNPEFQLEPTVDKFYRPDESPLAPALSAIEGIARALSLDSKNPANDAAKHLLSCLSAVNQLSGWQHVQKYVPVLSL